MPSIWWISSFGWDGTIAGTMYPVGASQKVLGKSINCREGISYMREYSARRCFYSFLCCITLVFFHAHSTIDFFIFSIEALDTPNIHTQNSTLSTCTTWFGEISINHRSLNYLHRNHWTSRTLILLHPFSFDRSSNFWSWNASHPLIKPISYSDRRSLQPLPLSVDQNTDFVHASSIHGIIMDRKSIFSFISTVWTLHLLTHFTFWKSFFL